MSATPKPQKCERLVMAFAEAHGVPLPAAYRLLDQLEALMRLREGRAKIRGFRRGAQVQGRARVWRTVDGPTVSRGGDGIPRNAAVR